MEYGGHTQNKAFCGIPFISENRPSENLAQANQNKTILALAHKRRIRVSDIWPARPKPYNPRLLQNQISAAPVQAGAQCKAALCLSRTFPKIINYL